jgi:hypothetical protein
MTVPCARKAAVREKACAHHGAAQPAGGHRQKSIALILPAPDPAVQAGANDGMPRDLLSQSFQKNVALLRVKSAPAACITAVISSSFKCTGDVTLTPT